MFALGHFIWIAISLVLIISAFCVLKHFKLDTKTVLIICLILGIGSEIIKIVSVMDIIPMVMPEVVVSEGNASIVYTPTGQYSPYLEVAHLPFELCSLMNIFIIIALLLKDESKKEKLLTLMYITGLIGGSIGILLAYVTVDCKVLSDYFMSPRVWQFFIYHAVIVTLGLYLGFIRKNSISIKSLDNVLFLLVCMDFPTLYLNSIFSAPVYVNEKPVGLLYRANFFSSYVNPLGLVLNQKWQWLLYLVIRAALAVFLISWLLCLPAINRKLKGEQ